MPLCATPSLGQRLANKNRLIARGEGRDVCVGSFVGVCVCAHAALWTQITRSVGRRGAARWKSPSDKCPLAERKTQLNRVRFAKRPRLWWLCGGRRMTRDTLLQTEWSEHAETAVCLGERG